LSININLIRNIINLSIIKSLLKRKTLKPHQRMRIPRPLRRRSMPLPRKPQLLLRRRLRRRPHQRSQYLQHQRRSTSQRLMPIQFPAQLIRSSLRPQIRKLLHQRRSQPRLPPLRRKRRRMM